jgi:hypothetical protein
MTNSFSYQALDPIANDSIADPAADRKGKTTLHTVISIFAQDEPTVTPRLALLSHLFNLCATF